jgi:hypothetical protein
LDGSERIIEQLLAHSVALRYAAKHEGRDRVACKPRQIAA